MISKRSFRWLIVFLLLVGLVIFFRQAGSYMVKSDTLQKSDAIVVLMGSIPDRVLYATDLFHQEIAPEIVIAEPEKGSWDRVIARGVKPVFGAKQFIDVAVQLGVPDSCILVIPGDAKSTIQEAQIITHYLKIHPDIDTLTLISTNNHTLRAGMIFRKKFRKEGLPVTLFVSPSPFSKQDLTRWWCDREKIEAVISEGIKIVVFLVVEQWTL